MSSNRVLARLAAKAHTAQQNLAGGSTAPPPEDTSQENIKKRSLTDHTAESSEQQRNKRIQIEHPSTRTLSTSQTNPVRPLFGHPDNKDKEVIVKIEAGATWTSGLEHPMQALSVFDLPADAKNYDNYTSVEIINRARRRFGRFAAEFVHLSNMFEKFEMEESRQKLLEETMTLRNERRQLSARVEELQKTNKNLEAAKKSWDNEKAKLVNANQELNQNKNTLQTSIGELKNEITQLKQGVLGKDQELDEMKKNLAAAELEAENALKDGYVICYERCKAAKKEVDGMSYEDYLSELADQLADTTLHKKEATTAQIGENRVEPPANSEQQVDPEEKTRNAS